MKTNFPIYFWYLISEKHQYDEVLVVLSHTDVHENILLEEIWLFSRLCQRPTFTNFVQFSPSCARCIHTNFSQEVCWRGQKHLLGPRGHLGTPLVVHPFAFHNKSLSSVSWICILVSMKIYLCCVQISQTTHLPPIFGKPNFPLCWTISDISDLIRFWQSLESTSDLPFQQIFYCTKAFPEEETDLSLAQKAQKVEPTWLVSNISSPLPTNRLANWYIV